MTLMLYLHVYYMYLITYLSTPPPPLHKECFYALSTMGYPIYGFYIKFFFWFCEICNHSLMLQDILEGNGK